MLYTSQELEPATCTCPGALLGALEVGLRLARLYTIAFPDRPEWLAQTVDLANLDSVGEVAQLFLERVDEALFPVYDLDWHDLRHVEETERVAAFLLNHLDTIPAHLQGLGRWHNPAHVYRQPWPLLIHLTLLDEFGEDARAGFAEDYSELAWRVPPDFDLCGVHQRLAQMGLPEPLDALPLAFEIVNSDTGEPWTDYCIEDVAESGEVPDFLDWTAENVTLLHESWERARAILRRTGALVHWTEENPEARLAQILDAILEAHRLHHLELT